MATINSNLTRQVSKKVVTEDARKKTLARSAPLKPSRGLPIAIW